VITWQGETDFSHDLKNTAAGGGRVAIGPFQVLYPLHKGETKNPGDVFGTNLNAEQIFNGNQDANIAFGIGILAQLYNTWGDSAAGRYIGVDNGNHPEVGKRQNTFDQYEGSLVGLFENTNCFPHN
jgi:hypothetical protein